MRVIDIAEICRMIDRPWTPRIVAELNGQHVKLALLNGQFIWHHHEDADELFYLVRGSLRMKLRPRGEPEREVTIHEGQLFVVPRGVEHLPIADQSCYVLLFEPAGTLNTGNVRSALTVDSPQRIG